MIIKIDLLIQILKGDKISLINIKIKLFYFYKQICRINILSNWSQVSKQKFVSKKVRFLETSSCFQKSFDVSKIFFVWKKFAIFQKVGQMGGQ